MWRVFFLPELYDDLHEMPIIHWWKMLKDIDALSLIKNRKTTSKRIVNQVNKQREKLKDDFTDFFGVQKRQAKYLKLLCKHQEYVVMYAVTKNHIWTTRRLYVEIELEEYRPKGQKEINEYETFRNVSMSLDGASMNPQTMSVIQYYSDQNLAIKRNKQAKANLAKNKK